jgi:hypothetical protein
MASMSDGGRWRRRGVGGNRGRRHGVSPAAGSMGMATVRRCTMRAREKEEREGLAVGGLHT